MTGPVMFCAATDRFPVAVTETAGTSVSTSGGHLGRASSAPLTMSPVDVASAVDRLPHRKVRIAGAHTATDRMRGHRTFAGGADVDRVPACLRPGRVDQLEDLPCGG